MLNFDILKMYEKTAIKCSSEEQASLLCDEMRRQYPSFMRYFSNGQTKWDLVGAEEVCYAPHIFDNEGSHMELTTESYWVNHGYVIIPFEALLEQPQDFGEIETGDISLSILLS